MPHIEYAGGHTLAQVNESRRSAIANAPAWWQRLARDTAKRHAPAPASPKAAPTVKPTAARPWDGWGWVAGVCAPGVSVPAFSERDGERLPEQFTPECWQRIMRSLTAGKRAVHLTLGHGGKVLATTPLDLAFRLHGVFGMGLWFTARLRADSLPPAAAQALTTNGVGLSIGFVMPKGWITERSGIGRVRVIDDCLLDHVALIVPDSGQSPAYRGARCYGVAGKRYGCPPELIDKAQLFAYRELKKQAGVKF